MKKNKKYPNSFYVYYRRSNTSFALGILKDSAFAVFSVLALIGLTVKSLNCIMFDLYINVFFTYLFFGFLIFSAVMLSFFSTYEKIYIKKITKRILEQLKELDEEEFLNGIDSFFSDIRYTKSFSLKKSERVGSELIDLFKISKKG